MKSWVLFILLFFCWTAIAWSGEATVRVGLYTGSKSISYAIIPSAGSYDVYGDEKKLLAIGADKSVSLTIDKLKVKVRYNGKVIGSYSKVKFKGSTGDDVFRLKSVSPVSEPWPFDDDLEISTSKGYLKAINVISLDKYVAGVMESEIGPATTIEFLKAKAIICRTYALSHLNRHKAEGFNLCDKVHCQAYKSKSRFNPLINSVVNETSGLVITDTTGQLITAAFSANCGGQTTNSEDAWTEPLYYLRSINDPYCVNQSHAIWTKTISMQEWNNYFSSKHKSKFNCDDMFCYYPYERETEIILDKPIPLKQIRVDLKLKSTWFAAESDCENIILNGRGFGHGVGLCQEGAMEMSQIGFCYDEIINFYYRNVRINNLVNNIVK
ncbi:MAG: SpoIID/LytB domain-containing protein [Bacteroidia bacterium]